MSWVVIALISAAIGGGVSILEKMVLFRYIHSPLTLPLLVGLVQVVVGTILTLALPWSERATLDSVGWSLLSGALTGLSAAIFYRVLFSQEVSRAVPVILTFPIFAALIAVTFLDEQLSAYQWVAIMATVIGAILLSVRQGQENRGLFLHPSFYVLMVASVLIAGGEVIAKIAVEDLPVLNTYGLRTLGLGSILFLTSTRPVAVRESRDLLRQRSPALAIVGVHSVLIIIALLLSLWALSLGPVSLVTTLVSTRSLFVVLYSTALTLGLGELLGEQISVGTVAVKVLSITLIVGGVATITLS